MKKWFSSRLQLKPVGVEVSDSEIVLSQKGKIGRVYIDIRFKQNILGRLLARFSDELKLPREILQAISEIKDTTKLGTESFLIDEEREKRQRLPIPEKMRGKYDGTIRLVFKFSSAAKEVGPASFLSAFPDSDRAFRFEPHASVFRDKFAQKLGLKNPTP